MSAGILVVGASQAGVQVAASLRELGYKDPVTLVGAEPVPPYQRPPLSKGFLDGWTSAEELALRAVDFYSKHDIDLRLGERVTGISMATGKANTDRGDVIRFDRIALTTGARPRRLETPGADLDGVAYLRSIGDAAAIAGRLRLARSVVVIGGGFIGLEAAAAARGLGKEVTVIEAAPRLIGRAVAPVVSSAYLRAHERRGVVVHLSQSVSALEGAHRVVTGVRLRNGRLLAADLVLVGIGVTPRMELARQMGVECRSGVVVDRYARTSDCRVVAAGDVTVMPHPLRGVGDVRLESVQNAVDQAKIAAGSLVDRDEPYTAAPWFWSDQYDLKLQIAGLSTGYDRVVVRGAPESERFSALYYRDGHLIACDSVNRPADFVAVRKALANGENLPASLAADEAIVLKTLLAATG